MNSDLRNSILNLKSEADFAELKAVVAQMEGSRRQGVALEEIKPGMKPEEMERIRGELARIAKEAGFGQ